MVLRSQEPARYPTTSEVVSEQCTSMTMSADVCSVTRNGCNFPLSANEVSSTSTFASLLGQDGQFVYGPNHHRAAQLPPEWSELELMLMTISNSGHDVIFYSYRMKWDTPTVRTWFVKHGLEDSPS